MNYHKACLTDRNEVYLDHNPVDRDAIFVYGEEILLLLKKEFVGLNEVALYFKVNSNDRYHFVVKRGNEKMEIVGHDQYFPDILEAVSVYTRYTRYTGLDEWNPEINDECEGKAEEALKNKRQARFAVDSRESVVKRGKKISCKNEDHWEDVRVGTIVSWNGNSAYGIIRALDTKETLLFHVTGKKSKDWLPGKGQIVEFKPVMDKIKKKTIAVNVCLFMNDEML